MMAINFTIVQPSPVLFLSCHGGYLVLLVIATVALILNFWIVFRILRKESLRGLSFFTYIIYGSGAVILYMTYYLSEMAIVCIEQRPHLFLMTQSNCFLVNAPVYMAILMYEASILMLSADRSMAYMKPMIYRIKSVKYAIKLCTCSSILIILELSTIYVYQAINNGPVYCISTGAGMNPNSQRFFMIIVLVVRMSCFVLNIVLYSHRWINTQGNVQANPNLDTAQKRWLTTFKESQKPFFRLLLFLSISSLALGTPFGLVEYFVANMSDIGRQKLFRNIAIGVQYCAYIVDALSLLLLNKQIRPDFSNLFSGSSKIFSLNAVAPAVP